MARRQITEIAATDGDLPDLTSQQFRFVELVLEGKTSSEAYRQAYDCSNSLDRTIWASASRLRGDPKIAAWISAGRKAGLGPATVTLANHIAELENLRTLAIESGNIGAAVQAEQLRGKAMGHYTDRVEVTDLTDVKSELHEIAKISPELAAAYAKEKGVTIN